MLKKLCKRFSLVRLLRKSPLKSRKQHIPKRGKLINLVRYDETQEPLTHFEKKGYVSKSGAIKISHNIAFAKGKSREIE